MPKSQINRIKDYIEKNRKDLILGIKSLIPNEQYYINYGFKYCGCFKYIWLDGKITQYAGGYNYLEVSDLDDMPIESLIELYEYLREIS